METNDVLNHLKNCITLLSSTEMKYGDNAPEIEERNKFLNGYILSLTESLTSFASNFYGKTVRFYPDGYVWCYSPKHGKEEKNFNDVLENLKVLSIDDFIKSMTDDSLKEFNRTFEVLCRYQALAENSDMDSKFVKNLKGVFNA